jgi:hypothetical protein
MRFAALDALDFRCVYTHYEPGELHTDGRRYLPTHWLQSASVPTNAAAWTAPTYRLPVVDRHHRCGALAEGTVVRAQLVLLLSQFRLQQGPRKLGFEPVAGGIAGAPLVHGRVTQVAVWEVPETPLPYESLYCEYVIDVGVGTVGVRTHATAADLGTLLGTRQLVVGDWVTVRRPRIDVLGMAVVVN